MLKRILFGIFLASFGLCAGDSPTEFDDNDIEIVDADADEQEIAKVPPQGPNKTTELASTTQIASPLEGFNVEVKDLEVDGKTVRVSPFKGVSVVSINLCFKNAGEKLSPKNKESLVALLSMMFSQATELKTREQLEEFEHTENVHVAFASSDDHFSISGTCPTNKLTELFALINETLFKAKFNDSDLKRFKDQTAASLMQSLQSPDCQLNEMLKDVVCKDHPYGTLNQTYHDSLKNITAKDFKDFIKANFTKENLIISVCGEFDQNVLVKNIKTFVSQLPKEFKTELPKKLEISGPYQIYKVEFPVPQTVIKFLHKGIDHHHPDFFALQIAVGCLSDPFVGLLFKKVRIEKALAYGISAGIAIQEHFNAFGISTSTQTENVENLIKTVHEVFADVCKNGFPADLVENIKQNFIGKYKRSFDSSSHIAMRLNNYQLIDRPVDFHNTLLKEVAKLTPHQVNEAFKKFLNPEQFMIFAVGQ